MTKCHCLECEPENREGWGAARRVLHIKSMHNNIETCPFCGNAIGGRHDELCLAWKNRNVNIIGNMVAWLALMVIIIGSIILCRF